jgi:protein-tyrosine-phosphatase
MSAHLPRSLWMKIVLFVCGENSNRSQTAAAFGRIQTNAVRTSRFSGKSSDGRSTPAPM